MGFLTKKIAINDRDVPRFGERKSENVGLSNKIQINKIAICPRIHENMDWQRVLCPVQQTLNFTQSMGLEVGEVWHTSVLPVRALDVSGYWARKCPS